MELSFDRVGDYGVIKDAVFGTLLQSPQKANVYGTGGNGIAIDFGTYKFTCNYSEVKLINGVAPTNRGDAIEKISSEVFPLAPGETGAAQVEMDVHTAQADGSAGQVISIAITKQGATAAIAIPLNDNAVAAAIQSQQLTGQNLNITIVQAENGQQLTYTYIAK